MPRSSSSRPFVVRWQASSFAFFCLDLCVSKNANVLALALAYVYSFLQFSQSVY
jgi:hypothetical protein